MAFAHCHIAIVKPNLNEIFARQQYKQTWQKDLYSLFPTDHGFQINQALNKSQSEAFENKPEEYNLE